MYVAAAQAKILGPEDVYVKKGSTISLTCSVNVQSTPPSSVSWHHGGTVLDFNSPRYKPRESSSRVLSVTLLTPLAPLSLSLSLSLSLLSHYFAMSSSKRKRRIENLLVVRSLPRALKNSFAPRKISLSCGISKLYDPDSERDTY